MTRLLPNLFRLLAIPVIPIIAAILASGLIDLIRGRIHPHTNENTLLT